MYFSCISDDCKESPKPSSYKMKQCEHTAINTVISISTSELASHFVLSLKLLLPQTTVGTIKNWYRQQQSYSGVKTLYRYKTFVNRFELLKNHAIDAEGMRDERVWMDNLAKTENRNHYSTLIIRKIYHFPLNKHLNLPYYYLSTKEEALVRL